MQAICLDLLITHHIPSNMFFGRVSKIFPWTLTPIPLHCWGDSLIDLPAEDPKWVDLPLQKKSEADTVPLAKNRSV